MGHALGRQSRHSWRVSCGVSENLEGVWRDRCRRVKMEEDLGWSDLSWVEEIARSELKGAGGRRRRLLR